MNTKVDLKHTMHHQRGATLIVVLIMLVMITIMGIMGIRTAMTSLNVATNSQVAQLNSQTSDTPSNYFLNGTSFQNLTTVSNVVGQAISINTDRPGREVVFCYRPTSKDRLDNAFDITVLVPPGKDAAANTKATIDSVYSARDGFCDLTKDFGSSREAVVTQVAVKIIAEPSPVIGTGLEQGSELSQGATVTKDKVEARIRVTSTAMMPNFARQNVEDIQKDCIGGPSAVGYINDNLGELKGKRTVADCLTGYGIPFSTQIQEFELATRDVQLEAPI